MGQAGGFRQPITATAGEDPADGVVQVYFVAHGYVNGGDFGACAEDRAQVILAIHKGNLRAPMFVECIVLADENRLAAADGGEVHNKAKMAGDAEPARVGDALSVNHDEVRDGVEGLEGLDQNGDFPEGQESGDVLHGRDGFDGTDFTDGEGGNVEDHDGAGGEALPVNAGDVDAGNKPGAHGDVVLPLDLLGQLCLYASCFLGRNVPRV